MADVLNTSPSFSSVSRMSWDQTFSASPTNYTITGDRLEYSTENSYRKAITDLLTVSIPITLTSLLVSILLSLNLIWIGHHSSEHEFAGAALGSMTVNVLGNSILIEMTSGSTRRADRRWPSDCR